MILVYCLIGVIEVEYICIYFNLLKVSIYIFYNIENEYMCACVLIRNAGVCMLYMYLYIRNVCVIFIKRYL